MGVPTWALLVGVFGIIKGVREIVKKKALSKNSVIEVLFFYTLLGFVILLPDGPRAAEVPPEWIAAVIFKSFVVFIAWMCGFWAIKRMPVSLYGVIDLSRVLFAAALSMLFLGEQLTNSRIVGYILVLVGLLLVNISKREGREAVQGQAVMILLVSCFFNALSELADKILMQHMTSGQLQFWYMFFMLIFYGMAMAFTHTGVHIRDLKTNPWIILLSVLFIAVDRALFAANGYPDSNVIVMTLIKQCSVFVAILGGKLVYQERRIRYKCMCALLVAAGIVIAVI